MSAVPIPHPFRRRAVAMASAAVFLLLAGCGSDDSGGNVVADATKDKSLPTQPAPTTTAPQTCEKAEGDLTKDDKPEVKVPEGDPPKELKITDIKEGKGHEVAEGDSVKVQYTGVTFDDGKEFDTSWDDLTPLPVTVGEGSVIQGWEQGLVGMKPGGRRELVIPSDLAYGETGKGEDIGPDEALVFVIDLTEVCFPEATTTTTTTTAPEGGSTTTTAGSGEGTDTTTTAPEAGSTTTDDG